MTCYAPLRGYRSIHRNKNGKYPIVWPKGGQTLEYGEGQDIACGQCIGCRLDKSREWAIRCMHEARRFEYNSFITLTYNDANLPDDLSLDKSHWQKFMKKLRKSMWKQAKVEGREYRRISYYHAGEYGAQFGRPHYHACLFGLDFGDKVRCGTNAQGTPLYTSTNLESIWGKGFVSIGEVNWNTAAYTARYILKKITGEPAEEHYTWVDTETGEVHRREPEYTTMSRAQGIGKEFYNKHAKRMYPKDGVWYKSGDKWFEMKVPKFYDSLFEIDRPDLMAKIKEERKRRSKSSLDNTPSRLEQRKTVKEAQVKMLKRTL